MSQATHELSSATFVSLKAFGDLVILRRMLDKAPRSRSSGPTVIIASHLLELFRSLGEFASKYVVLDSGTQVPALFDVRRRGVRRATQSAWNLRTQLSRTNLDRGTTLIFDRVGWRERFIASHYASAGLPDAPNIYIAYRETGMFGDPSSVLSRTLRLPAKSVGIFPASRLDGKNVPTQVVAQVVDASSKAGLRPSVFLLEGERPDLEGSPYCVQRVPRSFSALATAVRSVDLVISADSLPAHLAEYFEVPVFVVTAVENRYWLPLTAYQANRWARFNELASRSRLHDFFMQARSA